MKVCANSLELKECCLALQLECKSSFESTVSDYISLFTPAVASVSTWFKLHRNAALGLVISGSSIGAVIYPIAVERLLPQIGFGWTVRVVALIQLVTLLIPTFVMKSRLPPRPSGPLVEPSAFRQASYTLYTIGLFFAFWGLYTPFFYAPSYLQRVGAPDNVTPYIISLMNVTSP